MPIDESLIIKLQADIGQYKKEMQSAAGVTQQTQRDIETSVNKITDGIRKSSSSFKGLGRNAGQAGIQIQQFVGQVQGGQSALLAFSQQAADLGIVLGAPLLGAVTGIAAAFAGPLIAALTDTEEALLSNEEAADKLIAKYKELTEQEKKIAQRAAQRNIADQEEAIKNLTRQLAEAKHEAVESWGMLDGIFGSDQEEVKKKIKDLEENLAVAKLALREYKQTLADAMKPPEKEEQESTQGQDLFFGFSDFMSSLDTAENRSIEYNQSLLNRQLDTQTKFIEAQSGFNDFYLEVQQGKADAEAEIERQKNDKIIAQNKSKNDAIIAQDNMATRARELIQLQSGRNIIAGIGAINDAFLGENKAMNAGLIIADTAAAAMAAYKAYAGIPGAGEAAAFKAIAFGAAQLAANNSASKGGGSISGGAGGGTAPTEQPTGQTTVEVSDIATNQTQVVRIELDGLDTFIEGVSKKIDEGKANGSL